MTAARPGDRDHRSQEAAPRQRSFLFGTDAALVEAYGLSAHGGANPNQQPASWAVAWALMLTAMMLPLLIAPIRHVRDRSYASRRYRAIALFLAGYGSVWMVAGGVLLAVAALAGGIARAIAFPAAAVASLTVGLAIAWHCSPARQRCLNRMHAHPAIAASGAAADLAVLRFGLAHGCLCVGTCWALMLLPLTLPGGHLPSMAGVTAWLLAERIEAPAPPSWQIRIPERAARIVASWVTRRVRPRPRLDRRSVSTLNISSL